MLALLCQSTKHVSHLNSLALDITGRSSVAAANFEIENTKTYVNFYTTAYVISRIPLFLTGLSVLCGIITD